MEIRSITVFAQPGQPTPEMRAFLAAARNAYPYPVQTVRLATPPFPDWWPHTADLHSTAQELVRQWQEAGVNYISLGPVQLRHDTSWLDMIPALLGATDALFATAEIADTKGQLDVGRCHHVARLILQISRILDNGFGNLYFAALANCPPGSPFFPVAYHHSTDAPAAFAIAVEAADLARTAIQQARTLNEARQNLVTAIETAAAQITAVSRQLATTHQHRFAGIDFSLAPYPTDDKSIGGAFEDLGVPFTGASGSLFAAAFLTEAIQQANFPRCGFSGLMLPVLEDSVLARRAAEKRLSLPHLLSYAAVCGVGLDTIPLPGDVTADSVAAILLDTAVLATRLRKPLTARLMPLPGLTANDPVTFDFPYFADSRVMSVEPEPKKGLLAEDTRLTIRPVYSRSE
ncbi:MAG: DUF711 family protein [Chloroflexi bacterium]|nr:MAG: DUF711 family protein [Chloroflexota bacterium]